MRILVMVISLLLVAGCASSATNTETTNKVEPQTSTPSPVEAGDEKMAGNPTAVIVTNKGEIRFELFEKRAPVTVANFIALAESGFYDGLTFHRYEPGFVIQGGDPNGDGTGGSDKTIPLEIHPELRHVEGAVGMARSQDPNSASSQFYITLAPTPFLDGNYAVFGRVTEGMDVVKALRAGDRMEKVTIER
jgi:cyclophilin family peptidyl-prolyl cis-trans isomerase